MPEDTIRKLHGSSKLDSGSVKIPNLVYHTTPCKNNALFLFYLDPLPWERRAAGISRRGTCAVKSSLGLLVGNNIKSLCTHSSVDNECRNKRANKVLICSRNWNTLKKLDKISSRSARIGSISFLKALKIFTSPFLAPLITLIATLQPATSPRNTSPKAPSPSLEPHLISSMWIVL